MPAILADPIAQGLDLLRTTVFGLFSGALLLSAVLGPSVGRAIDDRGGRGVLTLSNLVLAAGLVLLGLAQGFVTLALAWTVLGVGMAMGLYDPAFATLTGLYGRAARGPILWPEKVTASTTELTTSTGTRPTACAASLWRKASGRTVRSAAASSFTGCTTPVSLFAHCKLTRRGPGGAVAAARMSVSGSRRPSPETSRRINLQPRRPNA